MRRNVIALTAVIAVAVFAACLLIVHLTRADDRGRLRDVDVITLLYAGESFDGAGPFANVTVDRAAGQAPYGDHGLYSKRWAGTLPVGGGFHLVEEIEAHGTTSSASTFYKENNPRFGTLNDVSAEHVGPSFSYAASGAPDESLIYCGLKLTAGTSPQADCGVWDWWARYGQYTVHIDNSQSAGSGGFALKDFEQVVDLAGASIGEALRHR